MSRKTPIEQAQFIEQEYREYLKSTFDFGDADYSSKFSKELELEDLYKGPYLSMTSPFKTGDSLNALIERGIVSKEFRKLSGVNLDLKLYDHQQRSVEKVAAGRSLVITTGTGSGKTESFLYPILNEIMKDIEKGDNPDGVRAILLYPMNALVNDQMDRVRSILQSYPSITFGYFTGDTPEKADKRTRAESKHTLGYQIPDNELISREEIRERPPHLLFTNYSMLEYLLIRPNDSILFQPQNLTHWKYVVLDEAHTYAGAKAIEVALLLRRVTGLATSKPKFILTSATLGQQGESEDEILEFARNLTSAEYDVNDIIFANRKHLDSSWASYAVAPDDYVILDSDTNNLEQIKTICSKYCDVEDIQNASTCLYRLLLRDENVHRIYRALRSSSITFRALLHGLEEFNGNQLTALIHLINIAREGYSNIFDIKYHTFVRAVSGAYMTMDKEPVITLKKTNWINGMRAFEIGTCRYCNSLYILGKVVEDRETGMTRLYQNDDVDIYENYGEGENFRLDYFLVNDNLDEVDLDDETTIEYELCAKCGEIHNKKNLNAVKCNCGDEYRRTVIYVNNPAQDYKLENNILECPCCKHKSNTGVVRTPNLGKDAATAILSQLLYRAIDPEEEKKQEKPKKLSFSNKTKETEEKEIVKQFLAFSDSRQQASFYAIFFQSNHETFLNKRLLWEMIQNENYADIPVEHVASKLEKFISENELFDGDMSPVKHAWVAVLTELMKVNGSFDGEGLGLFHFALNLEPILSQLDDEDIASAFGQYNINRNDLENLINIIFTTFKMNSAIEYSQSTLTPEERKEYLEYRRFDNYLTLQATARANNILSFLPIRVGGKNNAIAYVKKVCNCNDDTARGIMELLFNVIGVQGKLFRKHANRDAYQIAAGKYILKNSRTSKYYKCDKCGSVTPYNIHDVCVRPDCDGTLHEIDPDVELAGNYYRKEYKNKKIEKIVVKEHTAQLQRATAKEYQNLFRDKKINVLSCSTTFEMGVDLGGLETVFLRNVPPTPANYVQRAGRAGRRQDSSAFVLTYCGATSHDYTYFEDPGQLISGVIKPPYFSVTNEKIILRHLLAASLGAFFRQNAEYYNGNVEALVFNGGIDAFERYVESGPEELKQYIDQEILTDELISKYGNFHWFDIVKKNGTLEDYVHQIIGSYDEYVKAQEKAVSEHNFNDAGYYAKQVERIKSERIIDSLSSNGIIPRYGFPVDVVNHQVVKNGFIDTSLDLNRDLKIAISEYAPESEILVDGEKYTSSYITVPRDGELKRYYFVQCERCGRHLISETNDFPKECDYCHHPIDTLKNQYFIIPTMGFKTGPTLESSRLKPKKTYAGEVSYVGGGTDTLQEVEIPGALRMTSTTGDQLLVMNREHFYYCPQCGYSEINKFMFAPTITKTHKTWRGMECSNKELRLIHIGHLFRTDVVRIEIPQLMYGTYEDHSIALSFLYAFLDGISIAYNIERNDINGLLDLNRNGQSYDIIVYDDVPGGAGYIKRLMNRAAITEAVKAAKTKVSQNCCDEDTSCNHCLRNYYNQHYHPRLKRKYALQVINKLEEQFE